MKEKFGYVIKDSFGGFGGKLGLSVKKMDGTGIEWLYVSSKNADRWHGDKNRAEARIKMLEEINVIAQIPGLTWELIYADPKELFDPKKDFDIFILKHDILKGFIGKHRKAVNDISKKYKTIFKEISAAWRKKTDGGGASNE